MLDVWCVEASAAKNGVKTNKKTAYCRIIHLLRIYNYSKSNFIVVTQCRYRYTITTIVYLNLLKKPIYLIT